jgi:6-phosphogluconolactonase (cycloisomerase 2 family)
MHAESVAASGSRFHPIQSLSLPSSMQRSEGIAFSFGGEIIAVATSDTDTVFLFRRTLEGSFEPDPYSSIGGAESRLTYPHDVAFAPSENGELMAVAQRGGAIAIYRNQGDGTFGSAPEFEIRGPQTRLEYSDGVAFVPPAYDHLAACNLSTNTISFYRLLSASPVRFDLGPVFELRDPSIRHPDGLAFSGCGRWLAVANHGAHTVSVFRRRPSLLSFKKLRYGPRPVAVIKDPSLRHPHSVAFTPQTNDLVVTNAAANYFNVYAPRGRGRGLHWSDSGVRRTIVGPDETFREVNARDKMEGGPKGVAAHRDRLAICSPEHGVKIYSLRDYDGPPA